MRDMASAQVKVELPLPLTPVYPSTRDHETQRIFDEGSPFPEQVTLNQDSWERARNWISLLGVMGIILKIVES